MRWGNFVLLASLAHEEITEVYLAAQNQDGKFLRFVAVKRLRASHTCDPLLINKLRTEADALVALKNPHVVATLEANFSGSEPYMVLEYIAGVSLRSIYTSDSFQAGRPPSLEVTLEIARQIAIGLAAAHEVRSLSGPILHRDISPRNIILSNTGYCKIIDFGLAKFSTLTSLSQPGQVKGSLGYISPEQFLGKSSVDTRTDLFSLGVILWELLAGRRLFYAVGEDGISNLEKFCEGKWNPPSLLALNKEVDLELRNLVMQLLAIVAAQRPTSAQEVIMRLTAIQKERQFAQGPAIILKFLNDFFYEELIQESRKLNLNLAQMNEATFKEAKNSEHSQTITLVVKKKSKKNQVATLALVVIMVSIAALLRPEWKLWSPKITSTTQPKGNPPLSVSRGSMREVMQWIFELKKMESLAVTQAWDEISPWSALNSEKSFFSIPYKDRPEKERAEVLKNAFSMIDEFERVNTDHEKISILKKYSSTIQALPRAR